MQACLCRHEMEPRRRHGRGRYGPRHVSRVIRTVFKPSSLKHGLAVGEGYVDGGDGTCMSSSLAHAHVLQQASIPLKTGIRRVPRPTVTAPRTSERERERESGCDGPDHALTAQSSHAQGHGGHVGAAMHKRRWLLASRVSSRA